MTAVLLRARALLRRRWHAWAALGVVIGIFGGVAMALAQGAHRTHVAYPRFVAFERAADLVLAGKSNFSLVGAIDLDKVEAMPGVVEAARAFAGLPFSARADGGRVLGAGDVLPVASTEERLGNTIERWKMLSGRRADPTRTDEAVASFELAERLHLHIGSVLQFHFYDAELFPSVSAALLKEWPARLEAIRRDMNANVTDPANGPVLQTRIVGIEASPLEFPPLVTELAPVLHLTPAFAKIYAPVIVGSAVSYLRLAPGTDVGAFQLAVERLAPGEPVSFISKLENHQPKVQRSIRVESLVLALLAALVAFAGVVAAAQALTRQTFVESADDDTLRALGMQPSQLLRVAAIRSAVIAIVAATVACLVGWLAAPFFLLSLAHKANLDRGFPVDALTLVIGAVSVIAFTMVVGVISALFAGRSARTRARQSSVPSPRRGRGDAFGQSWLPLPMVIGARFAIQRTRRSAPAWTAIAGVGLCVALLAFASTFTWLLRRDLAEKHRYGWNWDVKVGAPALPDLDEVLRPGLQALPDVTDLSVASVTQIDVGTTRVDVLAIDPVVGSAGPTIVAGRAPTASGEIVLGSRTMHALQTGLGRIIAVRIGASKATYRVVGQAIFPEFGDSGQLGTGAWMTIPALRRVLPSTARNSFLIAFRGSPDKAARVAQLRDVLSPLPSHVDARPEDLVNLSRDDTLLIALGLVLGLLALAMLAHTVVTAARQGRHNHATLRALGYSRSQSGLTVLWQSLALAMGALALGLPLGLLAGRQIWTVYATGLGVATDAFVPLAPIVISLVGTAVVAVLAAVPSSWYVLRSNLADTLRGGGLTPACSGALAETLREVGHAPQVCITVLGLADCDVLGVDATGEHRRHVVLEAVSGYRVGDAGRAVLGGHFLHVEQCGLVVRLVPDLGGDRARQHELHIDAGPCEIEQHRLGEPAHRVLGRVVRGFVRDRDAAAHARDEENLPARALHHPREHGERHADGGVEVDVHDVLHVGGRELGDARALRDRGIVHEHVEPAEQIPRLDRDLLGAREIAEVGRPHARVGRELPASLEHFFQALGPPGDDADGRAPLGEDRCQPGADARRRTGHQDLGALDLHLTLLPSTCVATGPIRVACHASSFVDSCSAHEKMPLDIVEASSLARAPNTSARAACTPLLSGAAWAASSAR